jgi:2-oxoglutarate dehydrogenase E2 component (dihydrolipoamide succinyltransferase)
MSYAEIEKGMAALGAKARDGALAIEDMDGGTFTISNGGVFGSLYGTPIINPPQSAILGMHAIFDRPVARNGQVRKRQLIVASAIGLSSFTFTRFYISGCYTANDVRSVDLRP